MRVFDPASWPAWRGRCRPAALVVAVAAALLVGTRQDATVPFTGLGLTPAQLLLFVLALLWLLTRALGQRDPAGLGLLTVLLGVNVLITVLSYGLSAGRFLDAAQRTASDRTLLLGTTAATVVVVLATLLRTRRDIEVVMRALVVGGGLSGLFAAAQYATGTDLATRFHLPGLHGSAPALITSLMREGIDRPQGAATAPLELGAVMTVLIPIGLGVTFAARRRGERAWPWAMATALMAAGGAVSLSRSAFLGVVAALVVMVPRWPVRRLAVGIAGGAVALVVALLSGAKLVTALSTLFFKGSQDYSLGSRSDGRSYVWQQFAHHFWLGQGPGTYDLTTQKVLDNQYLSQLMETGTLGLLLFVAVLACAFGYAVRARSRRAPADAAELANGVAGALAAAIVVCAVLDTSGFVQIFTLIWLLIGLAGAIWRLNAGPGAAPDQTRPPSGFSLTADRSDVVGVR